MLSGLPASGKSTKAKELLESMGNAVRVNKDLLREMLHCGKFNGKNEGITVDAEESLALHFFLNDTNVIVDDTNFSPKHENKWKGLSNEMGAKFEHIRIDTSIEECVLRDSKREKKVGPVVIKNMALQYGLVPKPEKGYVLCDIDGTIADIKHRLPHVHKDPKDWKSFFSEIPLDTVRENTREMLLSYKEEGYEIIFISARPEDYKEQTYKWLADNDLDFAFTVIMRRTGDKRKDTEVKQDILDTYFKDRSVIYKVIDDRPSVIRMWQSNNLQVVDVGEGIEF